MALFNDEPEQAVRNRVMVHLSTGKKSGKLMYEKESGHFILPEVVEVDLKRRQAAAKGGGAAGPAEQDEGYIGEKP